MAVAPPGAAIRTQVPVPPSPPDGYATTAPVTYEANRALGHADDERDHTAAAQVLTALGVDRVRLLSNNPDKAAQLGALGIDVTARVPTGVHLSDANLTYLSAKARRGHHDPLRAVVRGGELPVPGA